MSDEYFVAGIRRYFYRGGVYDSQFVNDDYNRRYSFRHADNEMAGLALWPFGKDVRSGVRSGGCLYILMNVLWIFWVEYGFAFHIWGLAYCCASLS